MGVLVQTKRPLFNNDVVSLQAGRGWALKYRKLRIRWGCLGGMLDHIESWRSEQHWWGNIEQGLRDTFMKCAFCICKILVCKCKRYHWLTLAMTSPPTYDSCNQFCLCVCFICVYAFMSKLAKWTVSIIQYANSGWQKDIGERTFSDIILMLWLTVCSLGI